MYPHYRAMNIPCLQVEEKELDASKVQQAMDNIATTQKAELAAQRQR